MLKYLFTLAGVTGIPDESDDVELSFLEWVESSPYNGILVGVTTATLTFAVIISLYVHFKSDVSGQKRQLDGKKVKGLSCNVNNHDRKEWIDSRVSTSVKDSVKHSWAQVRKGREPCSISSELSRPTDVLTSSRLLREKARRVQRSPCKGDSVSPQTHARKSTPVFERQTLAPPPGNGEYSLIADDFCETASIDDVFLSPTEINVIDADPNGTIIDISDLSQRADTRHAGYSKTDMTEPWSTTNAYEPRVECEDGKVWKLTIPKEDNFKVNITCHRLSSPEKNQKARAVGQQSVQTYTSASLMRVHTAVTQTDSGSASPCTCRNDTGAHVRIGKYWPSYGLKKYEAQPKDSDKYIFSGTDTDSCHVRPIPRRPRCTCPNKQLVNCSMNRTNKESLLWQRHAPNVANCGFQSALHNISASHNPGASHNISASHNPSVSRLPVKRQASGHKIIRKPEINETDNHLDSDALRSSYLENLWDDDGYANDGESDDNTAKNEVTLGEDNTLTKAEDNASCSSSWSAVEEVEEQALCIINPDNPPRRGDQTPISRCLQHQKVAGRLKKISQDAYSTTTMKPMFKIEKKSYPVQNAANSREMTSKMNPVHGSIRIKNSHIPKKVFQRGRPLKAAIYSQSRSLSYCHRNRFERGGHIRSSWGHQLHEMTNSQTIEMETLNRALDSRPFVIPGPTAGKTMRKPDSNPYGKTGNAVLSSTSCDMSGSVPANTIRQNVNIKQSEEQMRITFRQCSAVKQAIQPVPTFTLQISEMDPHQHKNWPDEDNRASKTVLHTRVDGAQTMNIHECTDELREIMQYTIRDMQRYRPAQSSAKALVGGREKPALGTSHEKNTGVANESETVKCEVSKRKEISDTDVMSLNKVAEEPPNGVYIELKNMTANSCNREEVTGVTSGGNAERQSSSSPTTSKVHCKRNGIRRVVRRNSKKCLKDLTKQLKGGTHIQRGFSGHGDLRISSDGAKTGAALLISGRGDSVNNSHDVTDCKRPLTQSQSPVRQNMSLKKKHDQRCEPQVDKLKTVEKPIPKKKRPTTIILDIQTNESSSLAESDHFKKSVPLPATKEIKATISNSPTIPKKPHPGKCPSGFQKSSSSKINPLPVTLSYPPDNVRETSRVRSFETICVEANRFDSTESSTTADKTGRGNRACFWTDSKHFVFSSRPSVGCIECLTTAPSLVEIDEIFMTSVSNENGSKQNCEFNSDISTSLMIDALGPLNIQNPRETEVIRNTKEIPDSTYSKWSSTEISHVTMEFVGVDMEGVQRRKSDERRLNAYDEHRRFDTRQYFNRTRPGPGVVDRFISDGQSFWTLSRECVFSSDDSYFMSDGNVSSGMEASQLKSMTTKNATRRIRKHCDPRRGKRHETRYRNDIKQTRGDFPKEGGVWMIGSGGCDTPSSTMLPLFAKSVKDEVKLDEYKYGQRKDSDLSWYIPCSVVRASSTDTVNPLAGIVVRSSSPGDLSYDVADCRSELDSGGCGRDRFTRRAMPRGAWRGENAAACRPCGISKRKRPGNPPTTGKSKYRRRQCGEERVAGCEENYMNRTTVPRYAGPCSFDREEESLNGCKKPYGTYCQERQRQSVERSSLLNPDKKMHKRAARSHGKVGLLTPSWGNRGLKSSESAQTLTTLENSALLSDERLSGHQCQCGVDRARAGSSRLGNRGTPNKIHLEATISQPSILFDNEQISYMEIVPKYGAGNGLRLSQLDDPQVAHLFPSSHGVKTGTHHVTHNDVKSRGKTLSSPTSLSEPEILYKLVLLSSESTEDESGAASHSGETFNEPTEAKGLYEISKSMQFNPTLDALTYMCSAKITTKQCPDMTDNGQCNEVNPMQASLLKKCFSDNDATKEIEENVLMPGQLDMIPVGKLVSPMGKMFKSSQSPLTIPSVAKENKRSLSSLYPISENSRERCTTKDHSPEEVKTVKISDLSNKLSRLASNQEFTVADLIFPVHMDALQGKMVAIPGYPEPKGPDTNKKARLNNSLRTLVPGQHMSLPQDNAAEAPKTTLTVKQRPGGKVDKMSQCPNGDAVTELNGLLAYFSHDNGSKYTQFKMRDAKMASSVQETEQQISWAQVQKDTCTFAQTPVNKICQQPQGAGQIVVGNCEVKLCKETSRNAVVQTYPITDSWRRITTRPQQDEGVQTEITRPMGILQSPESHCKASLKYVEELQGKERRQQSYLKLFDCREPVTRVEIIEMKNKEMVHEMNAVNREQDFFHEKCRKEEKTEILRRNVTRAGYEKSNDKSIHGYNDTRKHNVDETKQQRQAGNSHFSNVAKFRRLREDFLADTERGMKGRLDRRNVEGQCGDTWGEEKMFATAAGKFINDELAVADVENYETGKMILETFKLDDYKDMKHYYYHKKPESPGIDPSPDKSIKIFQLSEYHRSGTDNKPLFVKQQTHPGEKETRGPGKLKTLARNSVSDQKLPVEKSEAVAKSSSSDNLLRNKRRPRLQCTKTHRKVNNNQLIPPCLSSKRKELEQLVKDSTQQLDVANKEIKIHINFNMGNSACNGDVPKQGRKKRRDCDLSHTIKSPPKKSYFEKNTANLDVQKRVGPPKLDVQEKKTGQRKLDVQEKKSAHPRYDAQEKKSGQQNWDVQEKKSAHPRYDAQEKKSGQQNWDAQEKKSSSQKRNKCIPTTEVNGDVGESDMKHNRKGKSHNTCCQHTKTSPQKITKDAHQFVAARETKTAVRRTKCGLSQKQTFLESGVEVIGPLIQEPSIEKPTVRHMSYHCSESEGQLMGGRTGSTLVVGHAVHDVPTKHLCGREQSQVSTCPANTLLEASSNKTTSGGRDPNELHRKTDIYNTLLSALLLALSGPKLVNESLTDRVDSARDEPRSSVSENAHKNVGGKYKSTISKDARLHKEHKPALCSRLRLGKWEGTKSKIPVPLRFSRMSIGLTSDLRPPRGLTGSKQNSVFKTGLKAAIGKDGSKSADVKLTSLRSERKMIGSKLTQPNRAHVYAKPAARQKEIAYTAKQKLSPKNFLSMKRSNSSTLRFEPKSRLPQGTRVKSQGNVHIDEDSDSDGGNLKAASRAVHFEARVVEDEGVEKEHHGALVEHTGFKKTMAKHLPTSPPKPSTYRTKPIRPTGSLQHARKSFKPILGHLSRQLGDEFQSKQHELSKPEAEKTPVLLHEQFFFNQQRLSGTSNLDQQGGIKLTAIPRDDTSVTDAIHCEYLLKAATAAAPGRTGNSGTAKVANDRRFRGGGKIQTSRVVDKNVSYGAMGRNRLVIKNEDLLKMPVAMFEIPRTKPSVALTPTQLAYQQNLTKNLRKGSDRKRSMIQHEAKTLEKTTALQLTPSNSQDHNVPEGSFREKSTGSPVIMRHSSATPQTTKTSSPLLCPSSSISIVLDTTDDVSASILCENLSPDQQVNFTRGSPALFQPRVGAPQRRRVMKATKRFKIGTPRVPPHAGQLKDAKRY